VLSSAGDDDDDYLEDPVDDEEDYVEDSVSEDEGPRRGRGRGTRGAPRNRNGKGPVRRRRNQAQESGGDGDPEAEVSRPPKKWGAHARDRVIKAMQDYGFGRWTKIRNEGMAHERDLQDIEAFCRSFVLQCGLCAGDPGKQQQRRSESKFVRDAIMAANKLEQQIKAGQIVMPEALQDERFVAKLKTGHARKALVRLDILLRLQTPLITQAVNDVIASLSPEQKVARGLTDEIVLAQPFEYRLERVTKAEAASVLQLGDFRPSWSRLTPWWDIECDKNLLVGVYWHGYGKYAEIRDDPELCFGRKIAEFLAANPNVIGMLRAAATNVGSSKDQMLSPDYAWRPMRISLRCDGAERLVLLPGKRVSQYRGVYSQPGSVMWVAQVQGPAKVLCVGYFETEKDAALAYDEELRKIAGDHAEPECNFSKTGERNPDVTSSDNPLSLAWSRSSRYRGVRAAGAKWTAQISYGGQNHHLGTFGSELEAAIAYDDLSKLHHTGSNAVYNFPQGVAQELDRIDRIIKDLRAKGEFDDSTVQSKLDVVARKKRKTPTKEKGDGEEGDGDMDLEARGEAPMQIDRTDSEGPNEGNPQSGMSVTEAEEGASAVLDDASQDTGGQDTAMDVESQATSKAAGSRGAPDGDEDEEEEDDDAPKAGEKLGAVAGAPSGSEARDDSQEDAAKGEDEEDGGESKAGEAEATSTASPWEKYWPDRKLVCKLVTWLIDEPDARVTQEEIRKLDEDKKKVKVSAPQASEIGFSLSTLSLVGSR
jgi:hypothetical protein